jgi:hypothetical protein
MIISELTSKAAGNAVGGQSERITSTAKALGLTIPDKLVALANAVIE